MSTRIGSLSFQAVALAISLAVATHANGQVEGAWAQPDDNLFPSLVIATSTLKAEKIKALSAAVAASQQQPGHAQGEGSGSKAEAVLKALAEALQKKQQNIPKQANSAGGPPGAPEILGVSVKTQKANTRVRLTIAATQFFDESTSDDTLPEAGRSYRVYPVMKWNFKALAENEQQVPLNVVFKVKVDDEEKEIVKTITVRSIRDCPLRWQGQFVDAPPVDVSWMFAAYVNEDHPWIDSILRESIEQGMVDNFVGQQQGPDQTMQQVFAIWHTLQRRGFRYTSIATTPGAGGKVFSQDVRTFEDSLATAQGNCIDGTAVFASLLRKVGIEPFIVLIPGHAFLAFRVDNGKQFQLYGLETTMIGLTDIRAEANAARMNQVSGLSFCDAVREGTKKLAEAAKVIDDGKPHPGYELLPIGLIRDIGIPPLPSRAGRELTLPASPDKVLRKKNPRAIPKMGAMGGVKFSLSATQRAAMTGPGLVLTLNNNYPWAIQATVSKLDAKGAPVKAARLYLPPDGKGEIGHAEGIAWTAGDQVLVEAPGYEPYRVNLGK